MQNDILLFPLQDWDHPTLLPQPATTPTSHAHWPHPPAIPIDTLTCYTLQPLPLVLWLMCVVDGCVRWACQVGVSHLPDTPTCHTYLLLLQPLPCVHATHVSGRCVRWACQVGVSGGRVRLSGRCVTPTYHTHMPQGDIGKFVAVKYSDHTELYIWLYSTISRIPISRALQKYKTKNQTCSWVCYPLSVYWIEDTLLLIVK